MLMHIGSNPGVTDEEKAAIMKAKAQGISANEEAELRERLRLKSLADGLEGGGKFTVKDLLRGYKVKR